MSRNESTAPRHTFEVRDLRQGNWVWSHTKVLFCPYVTDSAFRVYCGLSSYAGNEKQDAWPSYDTLAGKLNMGRSTVIRNVKLLKELSLLKIEKREGTSNLYYLLEVPEVIEKPQKKREQSDHHRFIDFFYDTAQKTRGFKPQFSGKDVAALKRVLKMQILSEPQLEQIALYFLADPEYQKFTPSLSTLFSNGILTSLVNKIKNDHAAFWKKVDAYSWRLNQLGVQTQAQDTSKSELTGAIQQLRDKLTLNT